MRVAVTGSGGRLGSALVAALRAGPRVGSEAPLAWTRAEFDLDAPTGIGELLDTSGAQVVVHAAAWTDVDGCARDPDLALRRNGGATAALAGACAARGIDLIVISTNEVFDGNRPDGAYLPDDPPAPANPYGASKLAAERAATDAFGARGARGVLGIVRTAWLFGPGKPDFPAKILAAAERAAAAAEPLRVVGDEIGTPSYTPDVAGAIVELIRDDGIAGIRHIVNAGSVSRAGWARDILRRVGITLPVEEIPLASFDRASQPPRWGVLGATPLPSGRTLRDWREAMAEYAPTLAPVIGARP